MPEKLSDEEIIEIQELWDKGYNIPQIQEKTGRPTSTIDKYIKQPGLRSKLERQGQILKAPQEVSPGQGQAAPPAIPAKPVEDRPRQVQLQPARGQVLPPQPAILEPDEWLKAFLEKYSLNAQFIQLVAERVKLVGELPTSSQLANDIQLRNSGVKNKYDAMAIAEFYEYEVRHYLEERRRQDEMFGTPYQGIPVKEPSRRLGGGGIRVDPFTRDQIGYGTPRGDQYRQPYDGRRDSYYPQPDMGGYSQDRVARLEDDLRRREEADRRRFEQEFAELKMQVAQGGQQDPLMQEMRMEIQQLREERRKRVEDELNVLKSQMGAGLREQDVIRLIETREKKLSPEDIQHMIDQRVSAQKETTETDVKMQELKYNRETKKDEIAEKAKDREMWTKGFETMAQTASDIALAYQNRATGRQGTMQATIGENTMESNCPFCNTPITAPLSAKIIQCPNCKEKLEIQSEPEPTQQYIQPTPAIEERPMRPQATPVEQPPLGPLEPTPERLPEEELRGECPHCRSSMFIPRGTSRIECPACGKPLEVTQEQAPIQPQAQEADFSVEQQPIQTEPTPPVEPAPPPTPIPPQDTIVDQDVLEPETQPPPQVAETTLIKREEPVHVKPEEPKIEEEFTPEEKKEIDKSVEDAREGRITPLEMAEPEETIQAETKEAFVKDGYTLFRGTSSSGKPWYFFGRKSDKGEPVAEIPEGYEVKKNKRTGLPYLKRTNNAQS